MREHGRKPSWKVTCMNTVRCTPVFHLSCLMRVGGWLVVWCCVVLWCGGVGGVVVVVASVCPSCWSDASHFHSNCGCVFDDS